MNSYRKRNINWVTVSFIIVILLVKMLSVGFSALETIIEIKDINAVVRIEEEARVISAQQVSVTNTNQLSGNVTLHAKWIPLFNINYILNGGTNPNNQITEFSELTNLSILNPTNTHDATFGGWYQNSGLTGTVITTTSQLNSHTTLYAKRTGDNNGKVSINGISFLVNP